MLKEVFPSLWIIVLITLLAELVLSAPQGYNYYANQQRNNYYAQRAAQVQRLQMQRLQAQRIVDQNRYYYQQLYRTTTTTRRPYNKINRADSDNAKFLGSQNQESVGAGRTFKKKAKRFFGGSYGAGYGPGVGNGCNFRSANQPKSEGRVFWDINVYNVYPNGDCGGVGGFGGGHPGGFGGGYPGGFGGFGGGLADPIYGGRPIRGFFQNWLGLFLPGGALSGVNRPYQSSPQSQQSSSQTDPADYDLNLGGTGSGSDSSTDGGDSSDSTDAGGVGDGGGGSGSDNNNPAANNGGSGMNLTPGQLVSGVANTVNSVIQTLSSAPVYG